MAEQPIAPGAIDDELESGEAAADVATQAEDDDPLSLAGEPADPPEDSGRPEGVGP